MTKPKLIEISNRILEIIGDDDFHSELEEIYEVSDHNELSKPELESFIDYLKDEYVLDSELTDFDEKEQYIQYGSID